MDKLKEKLLESMGIKEKVASQGWKNIDSRIAGRLGGLISQARKRER